MTRELGFNLVEMIVVLAIMAVLLGLGLPSYRTYMINQKVQSTAEVFMAGLQMARGEAVKLNQRVEFILTDETPIAASVDTTNTSTTGRNWIVRALAAGGNTFVEGKSGAEGTGSSTSGGSPIVVTGNIAAATFDGFGMRITTDPVIAGTATFDISNPTGGNCIGATPAGPVRCLRVRLSRGGQTRLCDPAVDATDTRSCGI